MTNQNVIEIIDRLTAPSNKELVFTASEVFTAIANGFYYIHPGKDTAKFLEKIDSILQCEWKERRKMYRKSKNGVPYEEWIWGKMASEALVVMREMFNERTYRYYKEKIDNDRDIKYDENLLENYLYYLSEKELEDVFTGILTFKENNNFFISDENYKLMMEEFKCRSTYVAEQESESKEDYTEHFKFISTTPDYFFHYLCIETIIDIICRHIDIDPLLLAHMVKAYVYTETASIAAEYTGLAAKVMYGYDIDIFDPVITDTSTITPDIFNTNEAKIVFLNNYSEFMAGTITG